MRKIDAEGPQDGCTFAASRSKLADGNAPHVKNCSTRAANMRKQRRPTQSLENSPRLRDTHGRRHTPPEVMMKSRQESHHVWSLVLAAGMVACGAGSSLDEYADGVPEIVPSPIESSADASGEEEEERDAGDAGRGRDAGSDAGRDAGVRRDSGSGGQAGGTAAIGSSCTDASECSGDPAQCLTSIASIFTFPKGYCAQMGCQSNDQCPSGSGCLASFQTCLKTCTRNNECRTADGYQCAAPPLGGLGGTGGGSARYCLPAEVASIGGLFGGTGGTGTLGGLGGLLGGLGGTGALGGLLGGLGGTGGTGR